MNEKSFSFFSFWIRISFLDDLNVGHKIWKTTEILVVFLFPMKLNGNRWEEPYNSIHWKDSQRIGNTTGNGQRRHCVTLNKKWENNIKNLLCFCSQHKKKLIFMLFFLFYFLDEWMHFKCNILALFR